MRIVVIHFLTLIFSLDLIAQESVKAIDNFSKTNGIENFDSLISKYNLSFKYPINFKQIQPKKNKSIGFQYVIEHLEENFEIRYIILGLNSEMEKDIKNPDWNLTAKKGFEKMIKKISKKGSSSVVPIIEYPNQGVRDEFNADWGATISFLPNFKFGKKYNHCVASTILRDSTCQIIMFFMFKDVQKQQKLLAEHYYNLKFNKLDKRAEVRYRIKKEETYPGEFDFYINSSSNGLRVRTDNEEIKEAFLTVSDNNGKIHFQGQLIEHDFYLDTLLKGRYRLKIDYNGKQIKRMIEIF